MSFCNLNIEVRRNRHCSSMEEMSVLRPSYGGITMICCVQQWVFSTLLIRPKSRKKCSLLLLFIITCTLLCTIYCYWWTSERVVLSISENCGNWHNCLYQLLLVVYISFHSRPSALQSPSVCFNWHQAVEVVHSFSKVSAWILL